MVVAAAAKEATTPPAKILPPATVARPARESAQPSRGASASLSLPPFPAQLNKRKEMKPPPPLPPPASGLATHAPYESFHNSSSRASCRCCFTSTTAREDRVGLTLERLRSRSDCASARGSSLVALRPLTWARTLCLVVCTRLPRLFYPSCILETNMGPTT